MKKFVFSLVLLVVGIVFLIWSLNWYVTFDASGVDYTDIAGKLFPAFGLATGLSFSVFGLIIAVKEIKKP